jgi:hypothetical protein
MSYKNDIKVIDRSGFGLQLEVNGARCCGFTANMDSRWMDQAIEALREGDADGFMFAAIGNHTRLGLVFDMEDVLYLCGVLEPAVVYGFTASNVNNSRFQAKKIEALFHRCDRQKLLAAGDPLPEGDTLTIYRGVAGVGSMRRVSGLSWTLDLDIACWFASRFNLPNPAILAASVRPDEVFFYTDGRNEQEVVVRPARIKRVKLSESEIAARSARECERKRQSQSAMLASMATTA